MQIDRPQLRLHGISVGPFDAPARDTCNLDQHPSSLSAWSSMRESIAGACSSAHRASVCGDADIQIEGPALLPALLREVCPRRLLA
jgi:hypothetical protein